MYEPFRLTCRVYMLRSGQNELLHGPWRRTLVGLCFPRRSGSALFAVDVSATDWTHIGRGTTRIEVYSCGSRAQALRIDWIIYEHMEGRILHRVVQEGAYFCSL